MAIIAYVDLMNDDNQELISILQESAERHRDVVAFGHVGHAALIEELGVKSGEFNFLCWEILWWWWMCWLEKNNMSKIVFLWGVEKGN